MNQVKDGLVMLTILMTSRITLLYEPKCLLMFMMDSKDNDNNDNCSVRSVLIIIIIIIIT